MRERAVTVAVLVPIVVAAAIGTVIGLERELSHNPAGLRTQLLVTVGTALFVLSGTSLGLDGTGRLAANVVTGLGFLGAGVIFRERGRVRGLTTAALIWVNSALGVAAALENYVLAGAGTLTAIAALRILGAVERKMATKCRVSQYQITARDHEDVVRAVHVALGRSHRQEDALSFGRQDGQLRMRFAFCDVPARHRAFIESLRSMQDVLDVSVE